MSPKDIHSFKFVVVVWGGVSYCCVVVVVVLVFGFSRQGFFV